MVDMSRWPPATAAKATEDIEDKIFPSNQVVDEDPENFEAINNQGVPDQPALTCADPFKLNLGFYESMVGFATVQANYVLRSQLHP